MLSLFEVSKLTHLKSRTIIIGGKRKVIKRKKQGV